MRVDNGCRRSEGKHQVRKTGGREKRRFNVNVRIDKSRNIDSFPSLTHVQSTGFEMPTDIDNTSGIDGDIYIVNNHPVSDIGNRGFLN